MSNGAVIIANDTDDIDYIRLARISAKFVKRNLGLPVALITNKPVDYPEFDKVILVDKPTNNPRTTSMNNQNQTLDWFNLNRTDVYDLTPWHRTLLLDADLFVLTNNLKNHMAATFDFAIADQVHDPIKGLTVIDPITANRPINLNWATVVIFNKSHTAQTIFCMAKHIIKHYNVYAKIYDFAASPIRNDFAFSIATHLMSGYGMKNFAIKNYAITTVDFHNQIHKIKPHSRFVIKYLNNDKTYIQELGHNDIHFLNKLDLMQHIELLEQL